MRIYTQIIAIFLFFIEIFAEHSVILDALRPQNDVDGWSILQYVFPGLQMTCPATQAPNTFVEINENSI